MERLYVPRSTIATDAVPPAPEKYPDWTVYKHERAGSFEFNPLALQKFVTKVQKRGDMHIHGAYILKRLINANVPVINAHIHEYYLRHPWHVPEELRGSIVYSWGTIYSDGGGKGFRYVRCFYFVGGEIREDAKLIDGWDWRPYDVAGMIPGLPPLRIH